jgi:hypothetical protein
MTASVLCTLCSREPFPEDLFYRSDVIPGKKKKLLPICLECYMARTQGATLDPAALTRKQKARAVLKAMKRPTQQWGPYESSSSDRKYYVLRHGDDHLSCNCPAWANSVSERMKRSSGIDHRHCLHVDGVIMQERFDIEIRDNFQFVKI